MSLRRVRLGELIALVGAVCIAISLPMSWYQSPSGNLDAWQTFGPAVVLLILAGLAALFLLVSTLTERSSALPVAAAVWATFLGIVAVISAVVRVFERPHDATALCDGTWLALAGALAVLIGAWQSMRDERTSTFTSPDIEPRHLP
jgi:uncharacterized membrane protein HdeD (DUF308 family)